VSDTLTQNQAARRGRVIRAAMELAAEGGYDAVQMRDVAARAEVALGTIYRYFTSKDHLLAACQVEWAGEIERRLATRPLRADTPAERVANLDDIVHVLGSVWFAELTYWSNGLTGPGAMADNLARAAELLLP
jgi:AcrR family transcriptional regulator